MGYYSGDPGFFSLFKKAGSFAASFIPGVGGVASKLISKIPTPVRAGAMRAGTLIAKHPVLSSAVARGLDRLSGRGARRPGRVVAIGRRVLGRPDACQRVRTRRLPGLHTALHGGQR